MTCYHYTCGSHGQTIDLFPGQFPRSIILLEIEQRESICSGIDLVPVRSSKQWRPWKVGGGDSEEEGERVTIIKHKP